MLRVARNEQNGSLHFPGDQNYGSGQAEQGNERGLAAKVTERRQRPFPLRQALRAERKCM